MTTKATVLFVIDTETGGLDPKEASIVSIAAQELVIHPEYLDPVDSFELMMKPDRPVHPKAAAVNGYTEVGWKDAVSLEQGLTTFCSWLFRQASKYVNQPMWCGCNPTFDQKFFKSDCDRLGVHIPDVFSYRTVDVQSVCLPLLFRGEVQNLKLKELRKWAGCEGEQTHTAMGDVEDTCVVLSKYLSRFL